MFYLNLHTHHPEMRSNVLAVRNFSPKQFLVNRSVGPDSDDAPALVSMGIHPWNADEMVQAELATMASLLQDKQVAAVGEIGLDRCCDVDFERQQMVFLAQLKMAACVGLPVIVHCVKAWDELLAMVRQVDNCPSLIVHGFRGKPELANQLMKWGFFLSFGTKFNEDTLRQIPLSSLFLETDDDADADIVSLYRRVAEIKDVPLETLQDAMMRNAHLLGFSR